MTRLEWELKQMVFHNRDGAYATQHDRWKQLQLFAKQLTQMGYRRMQATSLRTTHVDALINRWQTEVSGHTGQLLTAKTLKNRLSNLRWWAQKIHKQNIIPRDNVDIGVTTKTKHDVSRAKELPDKALAEVASPHIALSLELQRHFGLRREEAIKIRPLEADHIDHIELRPSWCKGGRGRRIPITTKEQRELLERAKELVGAQSMIPSGLNYREHLQAWKTQTRKIGLPKTHGLRHRFAQELYQLLTGFPPPLAGGPKRAQLSEEQRQQDRKAREMVTSVLGHSRISITNTYLGR